MTARFIAVDWGTTNRRTFVIENGRVVHGESDDTGASKTTDFPEEARRLRERLGDLPMIMAGMVGSNIGWLTAAYVPAPAGLPALARNLTRIDARTMIVPGVSCVPGTGGAGVMRGEEVQFLGALLSGGVAADAALCQPGTHCKWARVRGGEILSFTTAMTGELFALLRTHSLLSPLLSSETTILSAFRQGVEEGRKRDLAASLFSVRADSLLGRRKDEEAASYVSGLLIGADVTARLEELGPIPLYIVSDAYIGKLYGLAVEMNGRACHLLDGQAAFVSGISEIWSLIQ